MKYTLKKPLKYGDKEIKELELKLENLTGADIIDAERDARLAGDLTPIVFTSLQFYACVLARAVNIPLEVLKFMDARDYTRLTVEVGNFFNQSEK